jgi:hypothetical protein
VAFIKIFEKYLEVDEVKQEILNKAIETGDVDVLDFFINKGYDIDNEISIVKAMSIDDMLLYFLKNGINIEKYKDEYDIKRKLNDPDIQVTLMNNGYDRLIYNTVGFCWRVKNMTEFADIISLYEDSQKYNI